MVWNIKFLKSQNFQIFLPHMPLLNNMYTDVNRPPLLSMFQLIAPKCSSNVKVTIFCRPVDQQTPGIQRLLLTRVSVLLLNFAKLWFPNISQHFCFITSRNFSLRNFSYKIFFDLFSYSNSISYSNLVLPQQIYLI